MATSLDMYITKAREKNLSDEQIKNSLRTAGWPEEKINAAFTVTTDTLIPPPPIPHVGMWTGSLYIIFFITLYLLATSLGIVLHQMVDQLFPIPTQDESFLFVNEILQGSLATILVSFPIFLYLAFFLKKQIIREPIIRNIRSRKIFIYITLISTFLVMLGHGIGTIFSFLQGSANTSNTLGHLAVTLLIAGTIFAYFISEVKYDSNT